MARPSKLTPARETAILNALRAGYTRTAAAEANRIPRERLSRWIASNVTFRHAVLEAEAAAEVRMTATVRRAGEKDWKAALAWLERRRPDDWARQDRIEIIGSVRELARREGWDAEEEALAVAEVEQMLRSKRGAL